MATGRGGFEAAPIPTRPTATPERPKKNADAHLLPIPAGISRKSLCAVKKRPSSRAPPVKNPRAPLACRALGPHPKASPRPSRLSHGHPEPEKMRAPAQRPLIPTGISVCDKKKPIITHPVREKTPRTWVKPYGKRTKNLQIPDFTPISRDFTVCPHQMTNHRRLNLGRVIS